MTQIENNSEIRNILKQKNIKVTLPRIIVLQVLQSSEKGLSAYEIEERLFETNNRINLATIYSTLKLYHSLGLVQRVKVDFNHAIYMYQCPSDFIRIECNRCGFTHFSSDSDIENKIKALCNHFKVKSDHYHLTIFADSCEKCSHRE